MNTHNFMYYVESALRVRSKQFDVATLLHGNSERDVWFSHFLCEASRVSSLGLGGDAFRHWVAGLFRSGVYVYSDNYRIGVSFASDPNALPRSGCQESRAHGNPWPSLPEGVRWVSVNARDVPQELRGRIIDAAKEIVYDGAASVILQGWYLKTQLEAERTKRKQDHAGMLAAWGV